VRPRRRVEGGREEPGCCGAGQAGGQKGDDLPVRSGAVLEPDGPGVGDRAGPGVGVVVVTRNGEPTVVMMAVDDLESLEDTIVIRRQEHTMRDLAQAAADIAAGNTLDAAELRTLMTRRTTAQE
jgi:antitoxin YefM